MGKDHDQTCGDMTAPDGDEFRSEPQRRTRRRGADGRYDRGNGHVRRTQRAEAVIRALAVAESAASRDETCRDIAQIEELIRAGADPQTWVQREVAAYAEALHTFQQHEAALQQAVVAYLFAEAAAEEARRYAWRTGPADIGLAQVADDVARLAAGRVQHVELGRCASDLQRCKRAHLDAETAVGAARGRAVRATAALALWQRAAGGEEDDRSGGIPSTR